jgi:tetratricopeptide (TPR) repeat protein
VEKVLTLQEKGSFEDARKELELLKNAQFSEEQTAQVLYLQGLLALEEGRYEEGRDFIWQIVGEYYDFRLYAFGESPRLRVLGAERVATLAGDLGHPEDVLWLEEMLGGDARLDWYLLRDPSGADLGRTKLSDLLEFQKIRAYLQTGDFQKAQEALGRAFLLRGKARASGDIVDIAEQVKEFEKESKKP